MRASRAAAGLRWTLRIALLLSATLAANCGGGGGGRPGLSPTITVDWPQRSRDVNSPSSALSFEVTLTNSSTGSSGVSTVVDRGNNASAFNQTYSLPLNVSPGTYAVNVTFWPLEDGASNDAGDPVGTASGSVTISSTALSLGSFSTVGSVVSVAVLAGQTVPVGSTIGLNAAAYNTSNPNLNADLVVSPGSEFWNVVTTDGSMTITPDGHVTATAAGSITVTATVDGIVSPPQTVTSYAATAVAGCTDSTYTPNYVQEMTNSSDPTFSGQLRHWSSFPLSVCIVSNKYSTVAFNSMAQQALTAWTSGTNSQATFTLVSNPNNADITITFEPSHIIDGSDDGTVGQTTVIPSASDNTMLSSASILVASDLSTDAQTLNTITHEMGHALGIGGHSSLDQDLMFPFLNDDFAPTSDDVNTLYTAYCGSFPLPSPVKRGPRPARGSKSFTITDRPKK